MFLIHAHSKLNNACVLVSVSPAIRTYTRLRYSTCCFQLARKDLASFSYLARKLPQKLKARISTALGVYDPLFVGRPPTVGPFRTLSTVLR